MSDKRRLAIVGIGPRGMNALEKLVIELSRNNGLRQIEILLFESTKYVGSGPVYAPDQAEGNWINVSERALDIPSRQPTEGGDIQISYFPGFQTWRNLDYSKIEDTQPDTFPPRGKLGEYLQQRFLNLANPLMERGVARLISEKVTNIELLSDHKIAIKTTGENYSNIDEVVLTIGHQPTEFSGEIKKWEQFAADKKGISLFKEPYPVDRFLDAKVLNANSTIAIRGFGLAMIDVVRNIANHFGEFKLENEQTRSCSYHSGKDVKDLMIPYSLNGMPPVPKVVNAKIDAWFSPDPADIKQLEIIIRDESNQEMATSPQFLIDAIAPIAAKVYLNLPLRSSEPNLTEGEVTKIAAHWLNDSEYNHPILLSQGMNAITCMENYVDMCIGEKEISLDFCIGQVWRLCEHKIYDELSFNKCNEEVFAQIIALEDRMKRYTYGPPLESIQQLLALSRAGVMNLHWADNPTIKLTNEGWHFEKDKKEIVANVMIDSVLDSPRVNIVDSPVVKKMLKDELIEPVHDDLGVATNQSGYVLSGNDNNVLPIAVLGRMAKGTIIGVDSILQCFGDRPKQWAEEAARQHIDWLNSVE